MHGLTRRDFFTWMALGVPAALMDTRQQGTPQAPGTPGHAPLPPDTVPARELDLSPAAWIWYPSGRTIPNTFILFRKELTLAAPVRSARGWVCADSRYLLHINGARVQWGPAPSDPRWLEVDPLDVASYFHEGENVIAVTALFYGLGDGTSPAGKPGFIFRLEVESGDGSKQLIVSDGSWRCTPARAWRPGHYKRWYLRSLQEEFDARGHPQGWDAPGFADGAAWAAPMILPGSSAAAPPISSTYNEYALDLGADPARCGLRARSIPLVREAEVPVARLASSFFVRWRVTPEEYFDFLTPDAYTVEPGNAATGEGEGAWGVRLAEGTGTALTFEQAEEIVGWPHFTIEAHEGTVVELMVQEHHDESHPALLNTHFNSWARFVCREGRNTFETFDYEAVKWLQLHIRGATGAIRGATGAVRGGAGTVRLSGVGIRRRTFSWERMPDAATSDTTLNRLIAAGVNTVVNSVHELAVDGMGRERQQYSGDGSHQLHAVYLAFGETRQPARFLKTFSQGITHEGYFLDCWPAYDRLARLWEREIQASYWGPILDHNVGFVFDCMHHYLYTGELAALREPFPRLVKFFTYIRSILGEDGLLPVENIGIPSVWIDHLAYRKQKHKQCAFNLYATAMMSHALAPLCRAFGEQAWEQEALECARGILERTQKKFWDGNIYVANLPWAAEEGERRTCDRSLSTAILFDLCPDGRTEGALAQLVEEPPSMGLSYPANACWRLWALAKGGRPDAILRDFRTRWAAMDSVRCNGTLQEFWHERPDEGSVMSHCCVAPLYMMYMGIAGIHPLEPGFTRCMVRPQPGDLERVDLTARTVKGDIHFLAEGAQGTRRLSISMPAGCTGELTVDRRESLPLEALPPAGDRGLSRFLLPAGATTDVKLLFT